jgi:hypothetical protein
MSDVLVQVCSDARTAHSPAESEGPDRSEQSPVQTTGGDFPPGTGDVGEQSHFDGRL